MPVGDYDVRCIGKLGISNPRAFSVCDCVEVNETEPNDAREKANRVPLNCVVNGRINPTEDIDWFVFPAKKGQRVLIECRATRIDSRLDGMLTLFNGDGKELVTSQDENIRDQKRDPFIDFDVSADGDYFVKFTDFMYNGGADNFYRLSIGTRPYVDFITPTGAKPGTTAEITFYGRNLPPGVTAEPIIIGPGVKWGTLVVTAAPDAPIGEGEFEVIGTSERGSEKLTRKARGGVIVWDTVNTPAICRLTHSILLAVRETTPFAVTASCKDRSIKPGESLNVTVTAARRADMPSAIQLNGSGIELPPGLTIPTTTINPGQTEVKVLVTTTDKLKPGTYSFIINSESQVPSGTDKKMRVIYPSNPLQITVVAKAAK